VAFFVPQIAGYIKDLTGSLDYAFYLSGGLLLAGVALSRIVRRPLAHGETAERHTVSLDQPDELVGGRR
jgi:OFA family oxalate/formate antiporter-like MFS transporter